MLGSIALVYMGNTYLAMYAHSHLGYTRTFIWTIGALSGLVSIISVMISASLSDRVGRRRLMLIGWAACLPWAFVVIPLIDSGKPVLYAVAIVGMFALALAAGGSRWLALGAATLMACDNLLLVHGRIGTLDVPAVAAMIWAAALYLRRRPLWAGVVLGIGACAKEVAPYLLFALLALELIGWLRTRTDVAKRIVRLGVCTLATAAAFLVLLQVMGWIAAPYSPQTGKLVPNGAIGHLGHILSYAAGQTSPHGPRGIASYPWDWLVDYQPITYLQINPSHPTAALNQVEPAVHFLGMISPPILLLGVPALFWVAFGLLRRPVRDSRWAPSEVGVVGLAWFLGTYLPYVAASLIESRTSYLYYMVIVMPGIYLATADLVRSIGPRRKLVLAWMGCVFAALVVMYPFSPLPF